MPRPTIIERARAYLAAMPAGISGQGRHNATVAAANILLHGFGLAENDAWVLMGEYNARCQPPSDARKLAHRFKVAKGFSNDHADGWLIEGEQEYGTASKGANGGHVAPRPPAPKAAYEEEALKEFSGPWARTVDLVWLANRSAVDPAGLSASEFLGTLYGPGEKVLLFNKVNREGNPFSQGDAVWPQDEPPRSGPNGVYFLAQPVDGEFHANPRSGKPSRRSQESVTAWRYMLLESDEAPVREWLGAVVQLPLRIAALYTSGGRSVHALVRIDAKTKGQWDAIVKEEMLPGVNFLIRNGADEGVLSAVRLTRLPGCWRENKRAMQKLLYVNPDPPARPLMDLFPKRDVETWWTGQAAAGISDADATGGQWLLEGLRYYARQSAAIRLALETLQRSEVAT